MVSTRMAPYRAAVLPIGRHAVTDTKLSQANGDVSEAGSD
jgi:hypothetical protein